MPRDQTALIDITQAGEPIRQFTSGMNQASFIGDCKTQSAVLHQLLVIGEAVKRLSAELRAAHPEILWAPMAGMRDKIIHAYDEVDLEQVWETVTRDIPGLLARIKPLTPKLEQRER